MGSNEVLGGNNIVVEQRARKIFGYVKVPLICLKMTPLDRSIVVVLSQ